MQILSKHRHVCAYTGQIIRIAWIAENTTTGISTKNTERPYNARHQAVLVDLIQPSSGAVKGNDKNGTTFRSVQRKLFDPFASHLPGYEYEENEYGIYRTMIIDTLFQRIVDTITEYIRTEYTVIMQMDWTRICVHVRLPFSGGPRYIC